jgi:hypothetical protein
LAFCRLTNPFLAFGRVWVWKYAFRFAGIVRLNALSALIAFAFCASAQVATDAAGTPGNEPPAATETASTAAPTARATKRKTLWSRRDRVSHKERRHERAVLGGKLPVRRCSVRGVRLATRQLSAAQNSNSVGTSKKIYSRSASPPPGSSASRSNQNGGVYFSRYLRARLRNKAVDWVRKHRKRTRWVFGDGRVYERKLPEFVSLDDPLAETLPAFAGDPAADRDTGIAWLLDERDRERTRDYEVLGLEASR